MFGMILSVIFGIVVFSAGLGIIIGFLIFIPTVIYLFPYHFYIGDKKYTAPPYSGLKNDFKNANKVYKAWIKGEKPPF